MKELGVDGDNIKSDLQDVGRGHGLDYSGSEDGQVAGAYDCGMDFSSVKCGEFIERGSVSF